MTIHIRNVVIVEGVFMVELVKVEMGNFSPPALGEVGTYRIDK